MNLRSSLPWLLMVSFALPSCVPAEDLVEGEEVWDEGPTAEDAASDEAESFYEPIALAPVFQLPFPCDQVWSGQTRTNHSPQNSVDFNRTNDFGDTVTASAGGTVTRVENLGSTSYGRWIEISHGSGFTTRYAHLSEQYVSVGDVVQKGEEIGAVGNTGGSTGAHLHYEQRSNGAAVIAKFNGVGALYFGTKNYTSKNCNAGAPGTINTTGTSVNVRSGAGTNFAIVGSVADGAHVTITCQKRGQSVTGTYGTSDVWDFIGNGYVADTFVNTGSNGLVAPLCP